MLGLGDCRSGVSVPSLCTISCILLLTLVSGLFLCCSLAHTFQAVFLFLLEMNSNFILKVSLSAKFVLLLIGYKSGKEMSYWKPENSRMSTRNQGNMVLGKGGSCKM